MSTTEDTIKFDFKLIDNVSSTAGRMAQASSSAQGVVDGLTSSTDTAVGEMSRARTEMGRLDQSVGESRRQLSGLEGDLTRQQISLVTQMSAIAGIGGAVNSLRNGLSTLGVVSDETAQKLTLVSAGFDVIKGTAQGLTAVKGLMATLNAQSAIMASLDTYIATLKNPAMLVGVGLAAGAGLGVAGYYLTQHNSSNSTQATINIQDTTDRSAVNQVYRVVTGGAL